jgi:hypothetical protein
MAGQTAEDIDRFLELRKKYLVVGSYSLCSFLIKMLGVWQDDEYAEDQLTQYYLDYFLC